MAQPVMFSSCTFKDPTIFKTDDNRIATNFRDFRTVILWKTTSFTVPNTWQK